MGWYILTFLCGTWIGACLTILALGLFFMSKGKED